ncbi:histidine kinase [Flavihumibacter sp. RY-1]|uniref:Histidine kinase n=1 Tax=Flavihumibacter fluminis TaxID=2909236 RepID=A0ABS9BG27_9BACT|nr:histidine kinase [Flavihumibacter fluminis]MCF1714644.1 histidine kinase [Flavihumibacter fluminis]
MLRRIYTNRFFLLFIVLFAYAQSIYTRILVRNELSWYIFTPEGAVSTLFDALILFAVMRYFTGLFLKGDVVRMVDWVKLAAFSLITYLAILQLIGLLIAILFGNVERNFNQETFILSSFTYLLDGFIYGSFFLAYTYYKKYRRQSAELADYNKALYDSRMTQLKAQLNPHFLFNNLNVLDQLIYEDKERASEFLNEFADIYRYVLQADNQKIVPIAEELRFAEQYYNLIDHKYGKSYQLIIDAPDPEGCIVPLTLQLLIENAVKHNLGTAADPVRINISISEDIVVSNNRKPKRMEMGTSGKALKNLREQYQLLTKQAIEIEETELLFLVRVPKIQSAP